MFIEIKKGFTLAEVLITLGIIGVVAAITIPGLMTKIRETQFKTAYKKAYANLNQVMRLLQSDDVVFDNTTQTVPGMHEGTYYKSQHRTASIFTYMATHYFKGATLCFDNNADKCWACDTGEAGNKYGTGAPDWLGCIKENYAFIDTNGVQYYLYSNDEYPVLIDVNGFAKPNQLGRDRFFLYFADSRNPGETNPDSVDRVQPYRNIIGKDRWCPQGNCLYHDWLK